MSDFSGLELAPEVVDAQLAEATPHAEVDDWLTRRGHSFGGSDVPSLLVALGIRSGDGAPDYITDRARVTNRTHGVARIFAEKAGAVAPLKVGRAAGIGSRREEELLLTWRTLLERRQFYGEHEEILVPSTLQLARDVPKEWLPLVDRHCPRLSDTPDAWIRDVVGRLWVIQAKCSASEKRSLTWWWRDQATSEVAVQDAVGGLVVCGEFWAAWHGNDGPVRSWAVDRDENEIAVIRDAARRGWALVEKVKHALG